MKKIKTYVITVSVNFPVYHPRKGQETGFADKIYHLEKKHTIRGNYAWWKPKIDGINRGEAILSVRQWIGKPYKKPGQREIAVFGVGEVGIQPCELGFNCKHHEMPFMHFGGEFISNDEAILVAQNDGLSPEDFKAWFQEPLVDGCIIHFTDLRY